MTPRDLLKDPRKRAFVALALLGLILIALLWPLAIGRDGRHLTAYRGGDEDASAVRGELIEAGYRVEGIRSTPYVLDDVADARGTVLLILGTERRYDAGEASAVLAFLERGGSVILADETGYGTDIAREAGFAFSSERVLDTESNRDGDANLPIAKARVGSETFDVLFNSPASLIPLSNAADHDVIARSSADAGTTGSFLDKNGNGEVDVADPAGPFPLVIRTTLGPGALVLVADTGVFMNAQVQEPDHDNAAFARALVAALAPQGATVLLDESRHAATPALAPWDNPLRALAGLTSGVVAPILTLIVLVAAAVLAWRFTRQTEDWSHHRFDLGQHLPLAADVRPDLARLQRMARRRISERFNIPLEQVAAMTTGELLALTGDRALSEAASGDARGDPTPLFRTFTDLPPEAMP